MSTKIIKLGRRRYIRHVGKPRMPSFDVTVPKSTPGSDAALLETARRLAAFRDWWSGSQYGDKGLSETEKNVWGEIQRAPTLRVMLAPAFFAAGVLVKFREATG